MNYDIYKDIASRTNGDIYVGVVGPVRTGKSTFITKMLNNFVLPNIIDKNNLERTIDEMPQSGDGKSIMTTQPKFIPNEGVMIALENDVKMKVRMVDCVGYLVEGAIGHIENDKPRLVKTPWSSQEMPFEEAAEIGTNKVISQHSTIGVMVTTDGSITDIPRENYIKAEERVVAELKKCNKPFVILLNSTHPESPETVNLQKSLQGKYNVGEIYTGKVTNITDYGAFVELEDGIEGLVHVSEMSWTRKNVHPGKIVSTSQEVEVKVLEVDADKRRISLGIKQCTPNPWAAYIDEHPVGSIIEGKIKNITEFGLFVGLSDEIDGMIHLSDIAWDKAGEEAVKEYSKGQDIQAKIIDVDVEKERISLGIKQLTENTVAAALEGVKKGDVVKAVVVAVDDKTVTVDVNGLTANIKKADLSKDKALQDTANFKEGDEVEAKVSSVDKKNSKVNLSIKALEIDEEKKALEEYSSNTGNSALGDALGEALKNK